VDPHLPEKKLLFMADETELGSGLQKQFFYLSAVRIMA
jgi:hypothetical protein